MRVLIDTTYARRAPHSGTAVYVSQLAAALGGLSDVDIVTAANDARREPGGTTAQSLANALADVRWTQLELPRRARRAGADLIHHPLPAYARRCAAAQVVTVHDLAFERRPELFSAAYRRWAHIAHRRAARRADVVICPSETTAGDVRELWGIATGKLVVAHHGPGQDRPSPGPRPAGHFLYIGDAEPRKDLPTLLDAHRRYAETAARPLPLVLAGSARADQRGVLVERHPNPARLAELLAEAAALVHPSVYEGFGLTLLEAMAAGTPVIAAAAPGALETCGEAARYVVPGDPGALAGTLSEVAASPALRGELAQRGRARAAGFSWNLAARAHRDAYSLALS